MPLAELDQFSRFRMGRRQPAGSRQNARQHPGAVRGYMLGDENRRREICRELCNELAQRIDAAQRSADHEDSLAHSGCLLGSCPAVCEPRAMHDIRVYTDLECFRRRACFAGSLGKSMCRPGHYTASTQAMES